MEEDMSDPIRNEGGMIEMCQRNGVPGHGSITDLSRKAAEAERRKGKARNEPDHV